MGRRVLLVEDEYLLTTRIADEFGQLGVEAVGQQAVLSRRWSS
jgi:hypothetical protein